MTCATPSSRLSLGRVGEVEDVVATALFLATKDGDYFTGQTLCPAVRRHGLTRATDRRPSSRETSQRSAMIVEERCYTVKPGTVHVYYQDYQPRSWKFRPGFSAI